MVKTEERIAVEGLSTQLLEFSARLETLRQLLEAKGVFSHAEFERVLAVITAQGDSPCAD